MGFNVHGLAFKQSMMTLVGFSVVFATLFGVLSFQVQSKLSTLLTEKGEEISLSNVAIIEKLFEKGKRLGDEYAEVLGKEMLSGERSESAKMSEMKVAQGSLLTCITEPMQFWRGAQKQRKPSVVDMLAWI